MTDRSPEALLARRALAEKATPGKWILKKDPIGSFDDDVTFVTTKRRKRDSTVEIAKLECTYPYDNAPNAFNLEQRANGAHIVASDPSTVMADIDEILRLRAEVERLEKEADWLALVLANNGCGIPTSSYIDMSANGMSPPAPEHWRSAARRECAE